uniref:Uncharacterized protein n=1 Tax=Glossina palpalis gambiensis TaxID=67801 RepID=A0A1B0BPH8_9MUSC
MTCIEQYTFTSEKQLFDYVSVVRLSTSTEYDLKFGKINPLNTLSFSFNSYATVIERTNGLIASNEETSKSRRFSIAAAAAAAAAAADAGELNSFSLCGFVDSVAAAEELYVAAAAAATAFKADGGKHVILPMDIRGVCRECDGEGECSFFTTTSECRLSVGVLVFAALAAAAAAALATRVSAKA